MYIKRLLPIWVLHVWYFSMSAYINIVIEDPNLPSSAQATGLYNPQIPCSVQIKLWEELSCFINQFFDKIVDIAP